MSSLRHKITYLTTGLARAGAEMQLLLLCEKFVKAGWEVSVISLLPPEAFVTELKQLGIPLVSLELRKHLPDPRAFLRLVRTLRNWSPDVLHCHQVHANLLGRLARAFTNIPVVVCTAHSINEGPRWREWAYRLTDPLCDLTTNVCQAGVDRYVRIRAVPANKICYLPNGVDLDRFVHAAERRAAVRTSLGLKDEFVWLAVGNLRKPKDYPTMLEAFRQVRIGKPHARLVIVGGGPLNEALQLEVKEKGIGGVCFLGPREDVPDLMCAADGFLMSSSWEGTPLALLEANGLSLPVVATRVGGIAEVVVDTESGLLVRSGDPAALACACLRVMNASPEQRAELGRAGRNRVEALFSIDVVMKRWQQVYTQLWQRAQKHSLERGTGVTILHVLGDSSYGGAAKIIVRLAQLGCSEGWKARILTSDPGFQKAAYDAGIDYTDLDCIWREIRPLKDIVGLYRLWRFLKSERVTIVHTHTTKAGFIGRIAARLAGVPIIIHTVHGFAFHEQSSWGKITFYTVLEKLAACCCHRIITVSKFHRKWALDLRIAGAEKLQAIPNGIPDILETEGATRQEIRASLGVFDDDVMLFTPGRLAPEKGLEDLIAAVGATRGCLSRRLQVLLAGNGPLRPVLEQNARALGLTDEVRFLGFRTDIGMLLKAADIVALPSLREGLSIALLESMSAGRAIIATSIGSNIEAVGGSEKASSAAVIIQTKDRIALTDAIVRLVEDVQLREELGQRARIRWEREYTIERAHDAYRATYQDLIRRECLLEPHMPQSEAIKRLMDIVGSASLLLMLTPLFLACAAAVRLSSPGPILFAQRRLGLRARGFTLLKFRTMRVDAQDIRNSDGSAFSCVNDPRVTRIGHFLRKTSLDELPQLVNILRGEMSFVGPRPDQIDQLRFYTSQEKRKLDVKPGLTGLAQISGRNSISWQRRKQLDIAYVEQRSLFMDLSILCKTIPYVLQRRNLNANPDSRSNP